MAFGQRTDKAEENCRYRLKALQGRKVTRAAYQNNLEYLNQTSRKLWASKVRCGREEASKPSPKREKSHHDGVPASEQQAAGKPELR